MDKKVRLVSEKVGKSFNICVRPHSCENTVGGECMLSEEYNGVVLSGLETEKSADKCKRAIEYAFNRGFYNIGETYYLFRVKDGLLRSSLMVEMFTKFASGETEYAGVGNDGLSKIFRNSPNKRENHIDIDVQKAHELSRLMNRAYVQGRSKRYTLVSD